jgi:peroxiredoxin Q/BCP
MPRAGDVAPEFTAETDEGAMLSLESLRGRNVVLFFYPKDDTPGCTIEACTFRDSLPRFKNLDAVVLGVSPDSAESHRKFKEKFQLPYTLLVDADHAIADRYGVWAEKNMYGKKYWGNARTTFVIDGKGRIAHVFEKVKPEGHADEVAAVIAGLKR